jgi:transposase
VLFLPPYSSDFNPIELMWSKMKSFLRKQKARTFENLMEVVNLALENVTKKNISNWFKHCGYSTN